ncbi:MAG: HPP family protein [Deltaproteobacteria bacterium HGW-Deltaproteobacteria-24]|jgi:CBS-domain-containing membrane protein|nr:MAG: HPP family protein [Deltaproteobacteria bacterium HGW-Deltaproteobacteria-24]
MKKFLEQFKKTNTEKLDIANLLWSWIGSFLGILTISFIHYDMLKGTDLSLVIGSFGASAVLIYGAIHSPLAQPRNLIGGHILSAIVGVASFKLFGETIWFCSAFAVATSILVMQLSLTLHPPGGATSLIAVIGSEQIHNLGFLYVLVPVASGAFILFIIAIFVNNIPNNRHYPNNINEIRFFRNFFRKDKN